MPNLVTLASSSPRILHKLQVGVFSISRFFVESLINKNCHNSRVSGDVDMKLGLLSELGNRNKMASKKIDDNAISLN